ncbi:type 4a pilus biogenesis protein PilO [Candidatus Thiothrix sp. Deng01]|uniref:Type 4a pilus biogenesis protein PilO n=1 Tax=Candidatus Thiothrix phosphatis TaxID=3112415 RepID=A0ABU6D3B7_9GAMM|nr:type 4a pilus biogenesis protein PilO [Candidatus Thiothrix sp. Deng01]MEB4593286.1 type 4a pilus biogenesis protein PilO [Candidatus Thiothrix sp. Deng01]
MNLQELNNLVDDPGSVSWSIKSIAIAFIMGVILFLGYQLVITKEMDELNGLEQKEQELRTDFETKQKRASQLPQYTAQLEEMQRSFGMLLRQLPSDTEIPGLILDISEKGISNGLELELFEPQAEVHMDFYAEKPIKIIAKGSYRELATFVSDISGLPRIVTINNIDLKPEEKGERLRMEAILKTFRYLQDGDNGDTPASPNDKVANKLGHAKPAATNNGGNKG